MSRQDGTSYTRENLHDEARLIARDWKGRCGGWFLVGIGTDRPGLVVKVRVGQRWVPPTGLNGDYAVVCEDEGGRYVNVSCAI